MFKSVLNERNIMILNMFFNINSQERMLWWNPKTEFFDLNGLLKFDKKTFKNDI